MNVNDCRAWCHQNEVPLPRLAVASHEAVALRDRLTAGGLKAVNWLTRQNPEKGSTRMAALRLTRSLRKVIRAQRFEIRVDSAFRAVMERCAAVPRAGQGGTWITPAIIDAYSALQSRGHAHSVEAWRDGRLVGGLYGVCIGRMFFGESMFTRVPDASKCAFAALVNLLRGLDFHMIDCQQSTAHLASLGGREIARDRFLAEMRRLRDQPGPDWRGLSIGWPS